MNKTIQKRALSLVLVLSLILCLFPTGMTQAEEVNETTINFMYQDGDVQLGNWEVSVSDGLAEQYGYEVAEKDHNGGIVDAPSVFDALVAVHKIAYGPLFTPETAKQYLDISNGYVTKAFERDASASTVTVNDVTPNDGILNESWGCYNAYAYDCAILQDDYYVQFNIMQDTTSWGDYYTWFDESYIDVDINETFTLSLEGYSYVALGTCPVETIAKNILPMSGVSIYALRDNTDTWIEIGTTDENGQLEYSFDAYGEYLIKAMGTCNGVPIMATLSAVTCAESLPFWQSFGKDQSNNAVVSVKTPIDPENVEVKWISDPLLGLNWEGVSAPVITDDAMYVAQDKYLTKLDLETGKVLQKAELNGFLGYVPASIAAGDNQIFVAVQGAIEAYDLDTMERLWIYKDPIGGQAATNVCYSDGCVYTGFYNVGADGKKSIANYVCVTTDVDPDAEEVVEKTAKWTYQSDAGYYWAGAYADFDVVIFGAEATDGSDYGKLISVDIATGEEIDCQDVKGNVRSDICYSEEASMYGLGDIFFTTDAGYLYCGSVYGDGTLNLFREVDLGGKSTSTPVVKNATAYVGVCGPSQFGTEGHSVKVINLVNGEIVYEIPMKGFPQGSLLLCDAYQEEEGNVYLYATSNTPESGITLIVDGMDQEEPVYYDLYTPDRAFKNYCTSSVVCDEQGTLYYRNDSGRIFAIANKSDEEVSYGDVNQDGDVTAADALLVLQSVVKLTTLTDAQAAAADVNCDGGIAAEDALIILKYVVKLISSLPVE